MDKVHRCGYRLVRNHTRYDVVHSDIKLALSRGCKMSEKFMMVSMVYFWCHVAPSTSTEHRCCNSLSISVGFTAAENAADIQNTSRRGREMEHHL